MGDLHDSEMKSLLNCSFVPTVDTGIHRKPTSSDSNYFPIMQFLQCLDMKLSLENWKTFLGPGSIFAE